jgi:CheY-like chemotaxis protein
MDAHREIHILLVEDNPDHAELTLKALANGNLMNHVNWVKDGEEALDFLHHRRQWADPALAPRPGLILLDIKLPKVDGQEILRRIKSDEGLRSIPVVMLTTSDREEEIAASYRAGANSFVTKPVRFAEFMERIKAVKLYWMLTNRLPEG